MVLSLVGALGVRTVHQKDAKAQLVVQTSHSEAAGSAGDSGDEAEWLDAAADGSAAAGAADAPAEAERSARSVELQGLSADSDVLPVPRFKGVQLPPHCNVFIRQEWKAGLQCSWRFNHQGTLCSGCGFEHTVGWVLQTDYG